VVVLPGFISVPPFGLGRLVGLVAPGFLVAPGLVPGCVSGFGFVVESRLDFRVGCRWIVPGLDGLRLSGRAPVLSRASAESRVGVAVLSARRRALSAGCCVNAFATRPS